MKIEISKRLAKLPPYPFAEIDKKKKKAIAEGKDIISLGVGDPDSATPKHIVEAAQKALADPKHHHYPFESGMLDFRKAVAQWYQKRFGVTLDPQTEIRSAIGSKDGIAHTHFSLVNPGDVVLIPSPGYPVYNTSTIFSDGEPYFLPLKKENKFLPDLDSVPDSIYARTKILFLNSPNNPTAAVMDEAYFAEAIALAKKYNFIVAHDAAYTEIYYGKPPISFLCVPGAKDVGIEYHSCSKTYNMTGWRVGWFCGNADVVAAIGKGKDNFDSGVFEAVQMAAIAALSGPQDCVEQLRKLYKDRRDTLVSGLQKLGWNVNVPEASFYVWAETPKGYSAARTVEKLIEEASIVSVPGNAFGEHGEGYVRFSLTVSKERIAEAVERLSKLKW